MRSVVDELCAKDGGDRPRGKGNEGRNAERDFHGGNAGMTRIARPQSPRVRLFRKRAGKQATLCDMGYLMTENRHGLMIIDSRLTEANRQPERRSALDMIEDDVKPGSRWP
jgi:hypothetical protein